jgi:hypothetical protein
MTRSPLAYPLNRTADAESGGAADLQTDIMRFMAILSLCLVAIFALVQSLPMHPAEATPAAPAALPAKMVSLEEPPPVAQEATAPEPVTPETVTPKPVEAPTTTAAEKAVTLTRPKWVPKYPKTLSAVPAAEPIVEIPAAAEIDAPVAAPVAIEPEGFTLRFESDAALTRLVAASRVGVYAIESSRARRMTVSESRISFWDASTPNSFHEMDSTTVPAAVLSALSRTGTSPEAVSWGVTLPGKLTRQLDELMQNHQGGALVIAATGEIRWEAT